MKAERPKMVSRDGWGLLGQGKIAYVLMLEKLFCVS